MRPVNLETGFQKFALGSVLIAFGDTRVACAASIEEKVPPWLMGRGQGWMTAEYSMLPSSTPDRTSRETGRGGVSGRTQEIQRLIGRALRGVADLKALGERTLNLDCDVLQADGGTRTASITGAYVAAQLALRAYEKKAATLKAGPYRGPVFREAVAALSIGVVGGQVCVDLDYQEDSTAEVDLNLVMTAAGRIIEVQGTAEGAPFTPETLQDMVAKGQRAMAALFEAQKRALGG